MSLDRTKLQKVRVLANGGLQAQCPACAEGGQDRKGEHLRISPEGKFGCCVFPGDREHRSRIFALAGDHGPKPIKVRVGSAKTATSVQLDLLGRLGRMFGSPGKAEDSSVDNLGTLGTGFQDPRAYADENVKGDLFIRKLIGSEDPVPSVPAQPGPGNEVRPPTVEAGQELKTGVPNVPALTPALSHLMGEGVRLPYLLSDGTLVIPFNSPERYHWWKGRQSIRETLTELKERKEMDASPF